MFDLQAFINLPFAWAGLIVVAILLYVLLDGFDLGVGILFPFAPSDRCRDRMMNSIAPFWDGNETWLVLGGGGLFAAFPLAYSILMPAFYIPITLMLLGLIFRGVAFEFRFKETGRLRQLWDYAFHFGSLLAAFMQGMILGAFVHGIKVENNSFAGGEFDWVSAFSVMAGVALVFGYALLGSTWLIMKTEDVTQAWARKVSNYVILFVGIFMALVSLSMPFIDQRVYKLWFSMPNFLYLLPIPLLTVLVFFSLTRSINRNEEIKPFAFSLILFLLNYIGLGISLWPWIVPFKIPFWEAAAASTSLSFLLVGTVLLLPAVICYTFYCYFVFRGKASHEHHHY